MPEINMIVLNAYKDNVVGTTAIEIDKIILDQAKQYGLKQNCSPTKQIEYWAKIGKIAQDNPDLNFSDISDILNGISQVNAGATTPYKFG